MLVKKTDNSFWSGALFDGDGDGDGHDGREGSGGEDVFDGFGEAFSGFGDGDGQSRKLVLED
jgi:hypothetical protein